MFRGRQFVLLGFGDDDCGRYADLCRAIQQHGGRVVDQVTPQLSYVVTTPAEAKQYRSEPSIQAAIEYGIPVVSESFIWQATADRSLPGHVDEFVLRVYYAAKMCPDLLPRYFIREPGSSHAALADGDSKPVQEQLERSPASLPATNNSTNSNMNRPPSFSLTLPDRPSFIGSPRSDFAAIAEDRAAHTAHSGSASKSSNYEQEEEDFDPDAVLIDRDRIRHRNHPFYHQDIDDEDLGENTSQNVIGNEQSAPPEFSSSDARQPELLMPPPTEVKSFGGTRSSTTDNSLAQTPVDSPRTPTDSYFSLFSEPVALSPEKSRDRFDWQKLLSTYLTGEEFEDEKMRQHSHLSPGQEPKMWHDQLWVELVGDLHGRDIETHTHWLEQRREEGMQFLDRVIHFRAQSDDLFEARDTVEQLLQNVEQVEELYPSTRTMISSNLIYASGEFQSAYKTLLSWFHSVQMLNSKQVHLQLWLQADHMDMPIPEPFVEVIMKGMGIERIFQGQLFSYLRSVVQKCHETLLELESEFRRLRLPSFAPVLLQLARFPSRLIQVCLQLRLKHTSAPHDLGSNFPLWDQLIDDSRTNITLAVKTKLDYLSLLSSLYDNKLIEDTRAFTLDSTYDQLLLQSLQSYIQLVDGKFRLGRHAHWFYAVETLENEWSFLRQAGQHIERGDLLVMEQICHLADRMFHNIMAYFERGMQPPRGIDEAATIRWFTRLLENVRIRSRKILRFNRGLSQESENACDFYLHQETLALFWERLQSLGHVKISFGGEKDCPCIFVHGDLAEYPETARQLLSGIRRSEMISGYLLVFPATTYPHPWSGRQIAIDAVDIDHLDLRLQQLRLITSQPSLLSEHQTAFLDSMRLLAKPATADTNEASTSTDLHADFVELVKDKRPVSSAVFKAQQKLRRSAVRFAEFLISSVETIRTLTGSISCVDLIEDCFSFASDFGYQTSKYIGFSSHRIKLNRKLIDFAIEWVSFTCSDCSPTDGKTFRWAMMALEFVLLVTRGSNILEITDEEFTLLRSKVACCMTLLISHFNQAFATPELTLDQEQPPLFDAIQSGLSADRQDLSATTAGVLQQKQLQRMKMLTEMESKIVERLAKHRMVGKVLDGQGTEDQTIIRLLASSSSSISIRWQQGKHIGSGTFGSVYLAINLDTGDVMAVKEIRFQDARDVKDFAKSVQDEMTVLEVLSHPNVMSYYGIEVHRDKCFIFMEYCSSGSLRNLLENGRIEDDLIVQLYAFEILKGLEYIHSKKVLHRDIKPDNILLDHEGTLKLVDFGAAKRLESQGTMGNSLADKNRKKSLAGTPNYIAPEVVTGKTVGSAFGAQDIWSFGCVVLEMVTGKRPWHHLDNEWAIMYHIGVSHSHPPLPEQRTEELADSGVPTMTQEGLDFLKRCFLPAQERPTATELLQDPFFGVIAARLEEYQRHTPRGSPYPNPWAGLGGLLSAESTPSALTPNFARLAATGGGGSSYFANLSAASSFASQRYDATVRGRSVVRPPTRNYEVGNTTEEFAEQVRNQQNNHQKNLQLHSIDSKEKQRGGTSSETTKLG